MKNIGLDEKCENKLRGLLRLLKSENWYDEITWDNVL